MARVGEESGHGGRRQDHALTGHRPGLPELFEVEEEKRLVLDNGPADAEAGLAQLDGVLRRQPGDRIWRLVAVVEPVVRVPRRIAAEEVRAAVELVGPGAGDKLDWPGALAGRIRAR